MPRTNPWAVTESRWDRLYLSPGRNSLTQHVVQKVHVNVAKEGSSSYLFRVFTSGSFEMTFKSLVNFGGLAKDTYYPSIDRYHSGSGGYHHGGHHHSSRGSYKGKGGSNAAISALTLLAFLFLINVMQQSMQENNPMQPTTMGTFLLRDEQPVVVDVKEEKESNKKSEVKHDGHYGTPAKSKIQRLNSQYIK